MIYLYCFSGSSRSRRGKVNMFWQSEVFDRRCRRLRSFSSPFLQKPSSASFWKFSSVSVKIFSCVVWSRRLRHPLSASAVRPCIRYRFSLIYWCGARGGCLQAILLLLQPFRLLSVLNRAFVPIYLFFPSFLR